MLGLDWMTAASAIRGAGATNALRGKVVQGNIDPAALMAAPDKVAEDVVRMVNSFTVDGVCNRSSRRGTWVLED